MGDPQMDSIDGGGYRGLSSDNIKGLILATSSCFFIGSSFIIKKTGLKRAGSFGNRAGNGGYSYLSEPLWWAGMLTMIVGEIANFAAYAFAPAILVTPLGALSIIISAILAHFILQERLHILAVVGCVLCTAGSTVLVMHAPQEHDIESVTEIWDLATEPGFLSYAGLVTAASIIIIIYYLPKYGQTYVIAYVGVCSLVGSIGVMSVRALGITLKLTFSGMNQLSHPQTYIFAIIVVTCALTQINYLNKALDVFNSSVVSPIYYATFTTLTIVASVIMFKDWSGQNAIQIVSQLCGFVTILSGTFLLHRTHEGESSAHLASQRKHDEENVYGPEGIPLQSQDSMRQRKHDEENDYGLEGLPLQSQDSMRREK